MKTADCMTHTFVALRPTDTVQAVLTQFLKHRLDIACVLTPDGKLEGIVTKYVIYRLLLEGGILNTPIAPCLIREVVTVNLNTPLTETRDILLSNNVAHAVVVDDEGIVHGVVAKGDLIQGFLMATEQLANHVQCLIEHLDDAVVAIDRNHRIHTFNSPAERLFQQPQFAVLDQTVESMLPQVGEDMIYALHAHAPLASKKILLPETVALASFAPVVYRDQVIGSIAILKDLSAYEKMAHELETTKKLERMLESAIDGKYLHAFTHGTALDRIVTRNGEMELLKKQAYLAAQTLSTVLITGESGTGKELFAQAIHEISGRPGKYVKVNCAAIPVEMLESEFFGYADGAFTGARKGGKPGKFELADGGTLFLDEIGDMPLSLQAKLLRVLQEKEFERLGDTRTRQVNVRIVAATNKRLEDLIREGRFREDLYYRLHVIHLEIPPLRNRPEDLPPLCEELIRKLNQRIGKKVVGITPAAIEILKKYDWPGNVRELENVLERAMNLESSEWIEVHHLPSGLLSARRNNVFAGTLSVGNMPAGTFPKGDIPDGPLQMEKRDLLEAAEKNLIVQVLKESGGNRSLAAKQLGISRSTLYQKMRRYGIEEKVDYR
ncbi:sigma-54-dependent Fis family transcriptional regulator [Effusibacillus lacus]|uniref:Sigma-54-dependent Fis family transcriptional regulator n=1 Tax=Effusibacillus lacus TaxID=1348429 RepID=A0A292YHH6_9BACL|nr:sigma-54-dependent Fis family transcriptional regulator [Effusibacillus lacus]TCS72047.1 transcriptional regulator with PAS, ATPase and Fis domain [Effusibacillus lacus]GAX90337.1 sigma-54-dependent Fis family transcriptional regulator [Effusibacillus lacus]